MTIPITSSPVDIAISGLRAQSMRMHVVSNNIANAHTTSVDGTGKPYRRKELLTSTTDDEIAGVDILSVSDDLSSDFNRVLMAGHPHADAQGYVQMPNVSVPNELINMMSASRAYQASAAVLKRYQEATEYTLELIR